MRFGILLYQSLREWPVQQALLDRLEDLEGMGFSSFFVMDHHLKTFDEGFLSPLQTLSYLAAKTHRATLGQSILIATLHHPIHLAEELATLDHLSQGRAILGAGIGWNPAEFEAFGVVRASRAATFEHVIGSLRQLWSPDRALDDPSLTSAELGIRPYNGSRIPILMGGIHPRALRRIARLGDGWIPSLWASRAEVADGITGLKEQYRQQGRDEAPDVVVSRYAVARTLSTDAWRAAVDAAGAYVARRAEWNHPVLGREGEITPESLRERALIGSPDEILDQVVAYRDMGVSQINFRFSMEGMTPEQVWQSAELIAQQVMPRLPHGDEHPDQRDSLEER